MVDYNILFASSNKTKLNEVKAITQEFNEKMFNPKDVNIIIKSLNDVNVTPGEFKEDSKEYLENAKKKAEFYYYHITDDMIDAIMADDSGYSVTNWSNLPGIYTHRLMNIYRVERLGRRSSATQHSALCLVTYYNHYNIDEEFILDGYHIITGDMIPEQRGNYESYYMNSFVPYGQQFAPREKLKTFAELGFDYICKHSARSFALSEIYAQLIDII